MDDLPAHLPPPPPAPVGLPPPPASPQHFGPPPRVGQLSPGWRNVFGAGWVLVVVGFVAVWKSSWTVGMSTWWLGPQVSPRFPLLLMLPFVLPAALVTATLRNARNLPWFGAAAAVLTGLIGAGDIGRVNGFAAIEIGIAAGGLLVSLASAAGLLRPDPAAPDPAPLEPTPHVAEAPIATVGP